MLNDFQLETLIAIAQQAGNAIMPHYQSSQLQVMTKADESPVTAADLAANQVITLGLTASFPDIPILSEEDADIGFEERQHWQRYWLVDPLDGTKEFINQRDEFTVNIALIEHGFPIASVIVVPALNTSYFAQQGKGAFRRKENTTKAIKTRSFNQSNFQVVASKSHRTTALERHMASLPQHQSTAIGSSLKFCLIAEGKADYYPRLGPTSEWDTAAAQCIVEQAGGLVTIWNGERLRYNTKADYLNPNFVVIGDPSAPWKKWLDSQ